MIKCTVCVNLKPGTEKPEGWVVIEAISDPDVAEVLRRVKEVNLTLKILRVRDRTETFKTRITLDGISFGDEP